MLTKQFYHKKRPSQKKLLKVLAVGIGLLLLGAFLFIAFAQKRPRRVVTTAGTIVEVKKGDDLQSAIDSAQPGDTIVLEAGASFTGPITLPNKAGSAYITIQSSALVSLPASGVRISPAYASMMPKIVSPANSSAILTADAAHHFRFVGVEFTSSSGYVYNLINLGRDDFSSLSQVPHHLEFDRCYVHATGLNKIRRGFALNSSETTVINSYVSGFAGAQDETQAIACWNGPGPLHIVNNYLEAGAETILIGGNDPSLQGMVPSDIEIRGNYLTKALSWRGLVTIKTVLELKNARRVLILGNVIEHGLDCTAVTLTVRNQNGGAPWSVIEDVEVRSNMIRSSGSGVNVLANDNDYPSQEMKRVRIVNNLFEDIDHKRWGSDGYFLQISGGQDIRVEHNTVFHSASTIKAYGAQVKGFVFSDNILSYNQYGVWGDGVSGTLAVIAKYFPGGVFLNNVIVNGQGIDSNEIQLPPRNFLAPSFKDVGFRDQTTGDYTLAAKSRYRKKGTGGTDIGCDIDALRKEVGGQAVVPTTSR